MWESCLYGSERGWSATLAGISKPYPIAKGVSSLLEGNLAMVASCERAAAAGSSPEQGLVSRSET